MSLKRFFFYFLLVLSSLSVSAFENGANWKVDFEDAVATANSKNQFVLISFSGSDWCIPCIRLEKDLFSDEEFIAWSAENITLLKVDFPVKKKNILSESQIKHNEALAAKYNSEGVFPLVVIINPKGEVQGYMKHPLKTTEEYISSLEAIIGN